MADRIRRDSLLRNSVFIMSTTAVNSIFGFLFWLFAARLFPAEVVGLTAALIAASTILILLASLGVGGTLIQSLPEARKSGLWSPTFWAGMAIALAVGLVITITTIVGLPLLADRLVVLRDPAYAALFAVGTLGMTAGSIVDYGFLAERSAGSMLTRNSVAAAAKVVLLVGSTLLAGSTALTLLGAWTFAALVGVGLGIGLLDRAVGLRRPPRPWVLGATARGLRNHLAGQQLIGIGGALLPYVLSVLVVARLSPRDNAYFYTTWMLAGVFLVIAPAVSLSLFAEGANDPRQLRAHARSALAFIGIALVAGAAVILAIGGSVLAMFGSAYEDHAVGLLQLVVVASFPDAITNVYVAVLRVRGRLRFAAGMNLGMAVGAVALSWFLLPALGITAVGWAFLSMQLFGCAIVALDLMRQRASMSMHQSVVHEEAI